MTTTDQTQKNGSECQTPITSLEAVENPTPKKELDMNHHTAYTPRAWERPCTELYRNIHEHNLDGFEDVSDPQDPPLFRKDLFTLHGITFQAWWDEEDGFYLCTDTDGQDSQKLKLWQTREISEAFMYITAAMDNLK